MMIKNKIEVKEYRKEEWEISCLMQVFIFETTTKENY